MWTSPLLTRRMPVGPDEYEFERHWVLSGCWTWLQITDGVLGNCHCLLPTQVRVEKKSRGLA